MEKFIQTILALSLFGITPAIAQETGPNAASFEWQIEQIGQGTKPALALDGNGFPTIIYMLERLDGWMENLWYSRSILSPARPTRFNRKMSWALWSGSTAKR